MHLAMINRKKISASQGSAPRHDSWNHGPEHLARLTARCKSWSLCVPVMGVTSNARMECICQMRSPGMLCARSYRVLMPGWNLLLLLPCLLPFHYSHYTEMVKWQTLPGRGSYLLLLTRCARLLSMYFSPKPRNSPQCEPFVIGTKDIFFPII